MHTTCINFLKSVFPVRISVVAFFVQTPLFRVVVKSFASLKSLSMGKNKFTRVGRGKEVLCFKARVFKKM